MPNMTESYLVFPTGAQVDGLPVPIPYPLSAGATLPALFAPSPVTDPTPPPPGYTFAFWDEDATLYPTQTTAPITVPAQDFSATAWYWPDVGGPAPLVTTYAYSVNDNQVVANTKPWLRSPGPAL
jgi:hypothetical protein